MSSRILTVSYSELDTFRQCPLKHFIAYKERWGKPAREGSPLAKGGLWHHVMEAHYRALREVTTSGHEFFIAGTRPEIKMNERAILEICREAVMPHLVDGNGEQTDDQVLVEWMYEGYVAAWGADPDWQILAVEHKEVVPLYDGDGRKTNIRLKTKIDLIVLERATGQIIVVDHKSGGNLPTDMELDIDDQFGLYEIAVNRRRKAQGKRLISYTVHSAARTQRNKSFMPLDTRFSRTPMNRTEVELRNIELDAIRTAKAAYSTQTNKVPFSSPNPRQCGWKCDYTDPHLIARKGGDLRQALTDYGFARYTGRH